MRYWLLMDLLRHLGEKGQAWASVLRALWDQGQNEGGVRVGLCYLPGKRTGDGNIKKAVL